MIKKSTKQMVHRMLLERPELRNDDRKLFAAVVYRMTPDFEKLSARQLLQKYINKDYPTSQAIKRSRQWWAHRDPMCRAENYEARQRHAKKVSENINNKDWEKIYK